MTRTQAPSMLGIPADRIGNPHHVEQDADLVLGARHDEPGWVETAFVSCWDDRSEVGLYLHIGRCPQDVELFWAQVLAFLPGGVVLVDRSWGRARDAQSLDTGNLRIVMDRPHQGWTVSYDGAAQLSSPREMARQVVGSGPARPLRFDVRMEAAGPIWDLYAARRLVEGVHTATRQDWAQGTHTQQAYRHQGTLIFEGVAHTLDGFAGNDHSSGPRHLAGIGGDLLLIGGWPGRVLHYTHTFTTDGTVVLDAASLFGPDGAHELVTVRMPYLTSTVGDPASFDITVTDRSGTESVVRADVVATASATLTDDNDNLNGVDRGGPDHLVLNESRLRLTLPDGAVGAAYLERGARLSSLS